MQNLLFPFLIKYSHLNTHWWHRFLIVSFFAILAYSTLCFFGLLHVIQQDSYDRCLASIVSSCSSLNPNGVIYILLDILLALIATFFLSYMIQVLYYKVFIYIIYGKNSTN